MATTKDFIEFACDQIDKKWCATYKKMFGEYMVYINQKPILLVCDNVIYVKKITCVEKLKENWDVGLPYAGAKEHFVLDIEDRGLVEQVIEELERVIPVSKGRKIG
ncbi:MAG TPA: transcriptional regulator [Fibrobacteres bacterium]|jgi:TfoX/Sxy family transcriptional regulator of competence genes|nr:transcriptional regulator [Fibrobacterota bacterium]